MESEIKEFKSELFGENVYFFNLTIHQKKYKKF